MIAAKEKAPGELGGSGASEKTCCSNNRHRIANSQALALAVGLYCSSIALLVAMLFRWVGGAA